VITNRRKRYLDALELPQHLLHLKLGYVWQQRGIEIEPGASKVITMAPIR